MDQRVLSLQVPSLRPDSEPVKNFHNSTLQEGFPSGSEVKNLTTMTETGVQSLGWEDPLVKEMSTHFSIHAWRIPWIEESIGLQRTGHD